MTYVVITAAGMSSRFNEGEKTPALKCIYNEGDEKKTLLYSILEKCGGCRGVTVVGGYRYGELERYVDGIRGDFPFFIDLAFNPRYAEYGSGYSLKTGLEECRRHTDCTEVVFAEGDLMFDRETMEYLVGREKNCLTINDGPVSSEKSVAVYRNDKGEIRYMYNTAHGLFYLTEPFSVICNSGQVWKFADWDRAVHIMSETGEEEWHGTNLVFVERYFNSVERETVETVRFKRWVNCNTRRDYRSCEKYL